MIKAKDNKTFIVLGMHRSATSLIAKCLHEGGVHMGDKLMDGSHGGNDEGHFEDLDFYSTNMSLMGGDFWNHPELIKPQDTNVKTLLDAKDVRPLWGWKDPRTSLTIDSYYDFLKDPIIVATFRIPEKVADSLFIRDGTPKEEGVALAKEYNKRIIKFLEKKFT